MRNAKGFAIIELTVTLLVMGVLVGLAVPVYISYTEKAKSVEALINVSAIVSAEKTHKLTTGSYIAADNLDQINERLSLDILQRYYEYSVVDVTEDNFMVIAMRISSDVLAENIAPGSLTIVSDKNGPVADGFGQDPNPGGGSIGVSGVDSSEPEEDTSGTGEDISGTGVWLGGGTGDGGGGTGTGTGTGGGGGGTGGGTVSYPERIVPSEVIYDVSINEALNVLSDFGASSDLIGFQSGLEIYDFITDNNIPVVYTDMDVCYRGYWDPANGTININSIAGKCLPAPEIACTIAHEATHANYEYYPDKWIQYTKDTYGVPESEIHITQSPLNSIDQEYTGFVNAIITWRENKGAFSSANYDDLLAQYNQGPSYFKAEVIARYPELVPYPY